MYGLPSVRICDTLAMRATPLGQTVEIPVDLFNKWLRASKALEKWRDAFEDFLILNNPRILRELCKTRREHLSRKIRSWEEIKRDFAKY